MARRFKGVNGDHLQIASHQTFININGVWFDTDKACEVAAYIGQLAIKQSEKNWFTEERKRKNA